MATGGWTGFELDVPSIKYYLADHSIFDYKLPYNVPSAPCCTRISPWLYCCDRTCCACLPANTGQLQFLDVVNQEDGHQLRYRAKKTCCRVPRVLTFADGQHVGHIARDMRCGNRCLTCMEDVTGKPVLQAGLHNGDGETIARIDRNGRGSCCECGINTPMKCVGCCFVCLTCTCAARPSCPTPCFGCGDCDPVCCDCLIRGDKSVCECLDLPCLCIGCALGAPALWCPFLTCHTKRFDSHGTVHFRNFDAVSKTDRRVLGRMQALYRGNYPSAYTHSQDSAFKVIGHTDDSKLGMLLSGLAAGMVYTMGQALPVFAGLTSNPEGTSPGYDGKVETRHASQIKRMLGLDGDDPIMREDLIIGSKLVLGEKLTGVQVEGWRLVEFGLVSGGKRVCGMTVTGKTRMRNAESFQQVKELAKVAFESQVGEYGTTFMLRFELPDLEKPIVKRGQNCFGEVNVIADGFNPPRRGFIAQMESVDVVCSCLRIWRFPCNTNRDEAILCRVPLYAREVSANRTVQKAWEAETPPQVVMTHTISKKFTG